MFGRRKMSEHLPIKSAGCRPGDPLLRCSGGTLAGVLSCGDNERGIANRMADTAVAMGKLG